MTDQTFAAAALEWHDFFLAASGASAALLGLLFVGVSINLAAMARDERLDLRARASQAFANLIFVLVIALLMLVPDPHPTAIAINLGLIATIGLVRVAKNLRPIIERRTRLPDWLGLVRRMSWTAIADLVLIFTAWRIWQSTDAGSLQNLVIVVFVLLLGAADASWEILVEVSREPRGSQ
jgi:hypothetical protein